MSVLREEYGKYVNIIEDNSEGLVDVFETEWYRKTREKMTPGKYMRVYRENRNMTQADLGKAIGGIPRQHISNMEQGKRGISLKTARLLAEVFEVPVERFL